LRSGEVRGRIGGVKDRGKFAAGGLMLVAVVAALAWWQTREIEVTGRVALQGWDGGVTVPPGGRVVVMPAHGTKRAVQRTLEDLPQLLETAESARKLARERWEKRLVGRDEARRVLQVAERANAADLEACRVRLRQAESELDEAFDRLEARTAELEKLANPASWLTGLGRRFEGVPLAKDGGFSLRVRTGRRGAVVLVTAEPSLVWLQPLEVRLGCVAPLEFTNANLVDLAWLRSWVQRGRE
jgi:hypothetical protein